MPTKRAYKALISERLTFCNLTGGRRIEAWRTPEVAPGWHLYYAEGGVEIGRHPYGSDVAVRTAFERAVEEHTA